MSPGDGAECAPCPADSAPDAAKSACGKSAVSTYVAVDKVYKIQLKYEIIRVECNIYLSIYPYAELDSVDSMLGVHSTWMWRPHQSQHQ